LRFDHFLERDRESVPFTRTSRKEVRVRVLASTIEEPLARFPRPDE
jgi:hypothetical protein